MKTKLATWTLFLFILSCGGSRKQDALTFVTFDEETALGEQMVIEAAQRFKLIRNRQINTFVNHLGREIGLVSDWDGLTYRVHVINQPDICHFSLPGGHIYLFRGVLDHAENSAQVAGVIAHEITHIAYRHGVERLSQKYAYALAAQSVIGENPKIAAHLIENLYSENTILDYPKEHEQMADKKAIQYCWKANYDPAEYGRILRKYYLMQVEDPKAFALLLSTHPETRQRYQLVQQHMRKVPASAALSKGLDEFKKIKQILSQIPY